MNRRWFDFPVLTTEEVYFLQNGRPQKIPIKSTGRKPAWICECPEGGLIHPYEDAVCEICKAEQYKTKGYAKKRLKRKKKSYPQPPFE